MSATKTESPTSPTWMKASPKPDNVDDDVVVVVVGDVVELVGDGGGAGGAVLVVVDRVIDVVVGWAWTVDEVATSGVGGGVASSSAVVTDAIVVVRRCVEPVGSFPVGVQAHSAIPQMAR